nr:MAG TPA: hypothetical protein [Caudoviricetes sp.]
MMTPTALRGTFILMLNSQKKLIIYINLGILLLP